MGQRIGEEGDVPVLWDGGGEVMCDKDVFNGGITIQELMLLDLNERQMEVLKEIMYQVVYIRYALKVRKEKLEMNKR